MLTPTFLQPWRRAAAVLALASLISIVSCEKKAIESARSQPKRAALTTRSRDYMVTPAAGYLADMSSDVGGGGGGEPTHGQLISTALASPESPAAALPRKVIRNGSLDLLVKDLAPSIDKISSIAAAAGGYIEKSTQTNSGLHSASLTIRVPSERLDQSIADINRLAVSVEREEVEVRDVTRESVDRDARLRNAQAEETQYLQILKRATTIKDTLDVTEKLSDVRGRIEEMQGEMKLLTTQIDLSSLQISLHSESEATVAGIHWRPLVQAKIAISDMLSGLTDWVDSVVAFIIYLPLIVVWLISIVVLLVITVRVVRFLWRRFGPKINWRLPWKRPAGFEQPPGQGPSSAQS